jgi:hypothetical protein
MSNRHTELGVIIAAVILAASLATTAMSSSIQKVWAPIVVPHPEHFSKAPIATSGDKNVYVTWWSNKTGNDEVMFKASTDGGKTFGNKMNLSNSPKSESQDVQIAAAGNNVYVTWWERNQTMNEPVMKVSNDNGKIFREKIMLSNNATTAKPLM